MGKVRICLHHSSVPYQVVCEVPKAVPSALMTENDIHEAQKAWGNAIKAITKAHQDKQDFVGVAAKAAGELYAYGHGNVLFKPTKATRNPFRPTAGDAMSYFVGGEAMKDDKFKGEDAGFAINGGRGWSEVVFRNHMIDVRGTTAHAMGEYIFTDSMTGDDVTGRDLVQYTFGYKRCGDGQVRICLHHSSVPYQGTSADARQIIPAASVASVTQDDVHEAQVAWGNAIKSITKAHQEKKDFVGVAAKAVGELYGYGHGNVLQQKQDFVATAAQAAGELYAYGHGDVLFKPTKFKPTKATKNPFRPTAGDAMSYFVGGRRWRGNARREVYLKGEDAGFAINGGRGWSEVVFRNHMISCDGLSAHAIGEYIFTDATSGDDVTVQYTFGYKRCGDGQVRICLHHSSRCVFAFTTLRCPTKLCARYQRLCRAHS
eukprot:TRINITY_DN496_c0_g1_i6.p1 TRINITY_DN496_c0_g1~~TRINITY_DN496_c0_g1_i6.p1  ORF type:complete len:430 (+),score=104.96 TRINITY_DN496_c0_g1_i6:543-1832(+)